MPKNVFNCCIESENPLQLLTRFIDLKNKTEDALFEVEICGQKYQKDIIVEEIDVVVRIIRKNWICLQNVILNETTISSCELIQVREVINTCLNLIIECLKNCENAQLKQRYLTSSFIPMKTLSAAILPISELEKEIYLKLVNPSRNKEKCPVYQYFHTLQDIQFYMLLFHYISGDNEELKHHLTFLIKDLMVLSGQGFKQHKSAIVCECNKQFWLIIQILCERILGGDTFWSLFNDVVKNEDCKFVLWLLQNVGSLQAFNSDGKHVGGLSERIQPNLTLLESCLKTVILQSGHTTSILFTLKSLEPLLCNLWLKWSKIEIYQILWDYFSKRLNISNRTNINFTLSELVELIDTVLYAPKDCEQDFELFLAMLSLHMNEHPYHWGKMKGRIYSQLGPNKLKDLNDVGIFHVLLLFLSLTNVNFDEVSKKFVSFIGSLPMEKKQSQLIWSFYTAFIVRHVRENRDVEEVSALFIRMLEESTDQKLFHLIKIFVRDFDEIVKSSANLQLHQWLFINTWIHQYMTTCYYPDLVNLLNTLLNVIERVSKEHVWCDWESVFKNHIFPTLKYISGPRYGQSSPEINGTIAAKIALLCPSLLSEAFIFFTGETIAPKVSASFLCVVLENYPNSPVITHNHETIALQTWVKLCMLTRDGYEDMTRNIIKLEIVPEFIKAAISSAKDPLCTFIDTISTNIKHIQSGNMSKLCEILFGQAERWIQQYLIKPENEAVVLRIYTCIGLAFFKIGSLLYNKHKSNCSYSRLMNSIILPTELIVGKPIHSYILQSMRRTWHLFFTATVKLNSSNDAFIDRILREMIVRYIPHFTTADSPMLKCLDNEVTAEVFLEKLSNAFLKQPTKEAESNVFKTLRLISEFVQSTTSVPLLTLVVNKTLYGLFEVIMFHNQRTVATSTVKTITSSLLFSHVSSTFEEVIIAITEKHLAFNTPNYFQFLGCLVKLTPTSLRNVIPRIKQHISNVERMRGVGYDKNLRLSIERLEASLLQST